MALGTADEPVSLMVDLCLPALDHMTPLILSRVDRALARSDCAHLRDTVQIVLAEALNNVAEHAYRDLDQGAVAVRMGRRSGALQIELTDWGHALPDGTPPDGTLPNPTSLSEGGYGWFLIRALVSEIRYAREDGKNHLWLILNV